MKSAASVGGESTPNLAAGDVANDDDGLAALELPLTLLMPAGSRLRPD
jgi:hypothetical protein